MCCLTVSISSLLTAVSNSLFIFGFFELFRFLRIVSAAGATGFASGAGSKCCAGTSAVGSMACYLGAGGDCCDSPHPTSTTAAIVVISSCFISLQLSILHPSWLRVCGGGARRIG